MTELQHRFSAKAVAICDLGLCVVTLASVIGLAILIGPTEISVVTFIILVTVILFTALQVWADIRLWSATKIGAEPVEAMREASIWRNVSIVYFVIWLITMVTVIVIRGPENSTISTTANSLLFRGIMICYIFRYMQELKTTISSDPVSFTVTVQG